MCLALLLLLALAAESAADVQEKLQKDTIHVTDGDNNPFTLNMFENFDGTRDVFVKEQKLAKELKELRQKLGERREIVAELLASTDYGREYLMLEDENKKEEKQEKKDGKEPTHENPLDAFNLLKRLALAKIRYLDRLTANAEASKHLAMDWVDPPKVNNTERKEKLMKAYSWYNPDSEKNEEEENDLPTLKDYEGALNGLVILYDTYLFDPFELRKGRIHIPDFASGERVDLSAAHNLTEDDFARLSMYAYGKTWYDVAIGYARVYFHMVEEKGEGEVAQNILESMKAIKKNLVKLNNGYLKKKKSLADKNFKVLPYIVDDNLWEKKKQPKWITDPPGLALGNPKESQSKEWYFRSVCRGFSQREYAGYFYRFKCSYLHHGDPFLRLAPFPYEMASSHPFIVVIHKLFSDGEIKHLVDSSRPYLSRKRHADEANRGQVHEFRSGQKRRIVHKTVQHWLQDVFYTNYTYDLDEMDSNHSYKVMDPVLFKLSKKLEIATQLNVTGKYGSTDYQVTNYGLAGLCETHIDPHGYIEGTVDLPDSRQVLKKSGDMFGTVMGWIGDEPIGGATSFIYPPHEVTVRPTKGSAAFWFNLDRKGHRDPKTCHGGCPVLKGSKWILNKWIYFFNQFLKFPCSTNPFEFVQPFTKHYH